MIEAIKTFFGKLRGQHGAKRTVIEEGLLYRCTKCHLIFTTKSAANEHACMEKNI
jgi:hypothetical protein